MGQLDKFLGCLLGGAAGDALGYPVEFLSCAEMHVRYGAKGVQDYVLDNGVALLSDDTQMALFTACGLLYGQTRMQMRGIAAAPEEYVWAAYLDWLSTQTGQPGTHIPISWIISEPRLHQCRAPGVTCLEALHSKQKGTIEQPLNHSKGSGGLMRVAPVAMFCVRHGRQKNHTAEQDAIQAARLGANVAALTHGHPLGYIPAAAFVYTLFRLLTPGETACFTEIVQEAVACVQGLFPGEDADKFGALACKAMELAASGMPDASSIHILGEGWVAEEAFAIAVYCCAKYTDDYLKTVRVAVNHEGDSDTTGCVAGHMAGAITGVSCIQQKMVSQLELSGLITQIATDLFHGCPMHEYSEYRDEQWLKKYVHVPEWSNGKK